MKNQVAKSIKDLVSESFKVVSKKNQIEIFDSKERVFNINIWPDGRFFRADVNGIQITDGDRWAMPKNTILEEVYLYLGRKLELI